MDRGDTTFVGRPCKKGHDGLRFTRGKRACVECERNRDKARVAHRPGYHTEQARRLKKDHPAAGLVSQARQRARRKGLDFNLHERDIHVPDVCPVLGIPLIPGANWEERMSAPSLDRVNNAKGYIRGNVQVISLRANVLKNDSSIEELEAVLAYMKAHAQ